MSRGSVAPKVLAFLGSLLFAAAVGFAVGYLVLAGSFGEEWQERLRAYLEQQIRPWVPDSATLNSIAWLTSISGTIVAAALSLAAAWHFAEINLPSRLQDWIASRERLHRRQRLALIDAARTDIDDIPAAYEDSRWTFLRSLIGRRSIADNARQLAASVNRVRKQAVTLASATAEVQHRQITAHLVRGYVFESNNETDRAFEEFLAATRVRADDVLSRDIAAGAARRSKNVGEEVRLLVEMQEIGQARGFRTEQAMALRRRAEIAISAAAPNSFTEARDLLQAASRILEHSGLNAEAEQELGRVLVLFCEVQFERNRVGLLGPSRERALALMRRHAQYLTRPSESGGENYSVGRAEEIDRRIAERLMRRRESDGEGGVPGALDAPGPTD